MKLLKFNLPFTTFTVEDALKSVTASITLLHTAAEEHASAGERAMKERDILIDRTILLEEEVARQAADAARARRVASRLQELLA